MSIKVFSILCAVLILSQSINGNRIVGGTDASEGQFPYLASLRTVTSDTHFCGGVIIEQRWILSAAHCVSDKVFINVKVVLGATTLSSGGTSYSLSNLICHPNHNANTMANDISLLKTASAITFSSQIQSVPYGDSYVGGNIVAVVAGWGQLSSSGDLSDKLMWINLTTLTNNDCMEYMSSDASKVTDESLCTLTAFGQGVCLADSGGPLVYNNMVVGIVSWGIPCAQGKPDVYVRVSAHFSWINSIMTSN